MKRGLLLLLFIAVKVMCFGQDNPTYQTLDSAAKIIELKGDDTVKVNSLIDLARSFSGLGYFEIALQKTNNAIALSEKLDFKKGVAKGQNMLGIIYSDDAIYAEALKHYLSALKLRKEMGDTWAMCSSYINIGNVYMQQGNYADALKNYLEGLKIGEQLNNQALIANAYGSIANVYMEEGNGEEALKNHFIALNLRQKIHDGHGVILSYINIGDAYTQQANYKEALKFYSAVIEQGKSHGYSRAMSYTYVCIGNIYYKENDYQKALKNYLLGLSIEDKLGDKYEIANSYIYLGRVYTSMGQHDKAESYLAKGLEQSKKNKSKNQVKDAYAALSKLDSVNGDINGAFKYYLLYIVMRDSIFNEQSNKQLARLKIEYETDKKDQQIQTQNLQLLNQILRNRILQTSVIISLMVMGIIVLIFYLTTLRNKRKKKEYEHTLTGLELTLLRSQLNPHFISNSLSAINNFIDEQPNEASQFLVKFARLMRKVLEQNELPLISLKEEIETINLYMQIESLRLRYGFDYRFEYDESLDIESIKVPPLILQPTIENALWHGLAPKGEKGYIIISIKLDNGLLKFTVEDNGAGRESKTNKNSIQLKDKKSFGVSITRKRIEILSKELKNNGYYTISFLEGRTITEMALPVNYA